MKNLTGKREDYLSKLENVAAFAKLAAMRSKDPKTQVGAVIFDAKNRILALGYNGFPRGVSDDEFNWFAKGKGRNILDAKDLYVVHAERNAILNSASRDLEGATICVTLFPCNICAQEIIQAGIRKVIYLDDSKSDRDYTVAAKKMFAAAKVKYEFYEPTGREITFPV